jgi:hypothetical protein
MATGGHMTRALAAILLMFATGATIVACKDDDSHGLEPSAPGTSTAEPAEPGGPTHAPEFGEVVLATEFDEQTKEPTRQVTDFGTNTAVMYAAIRAQNIPAGSQLLFRWTKGTEVAASIVVDVTTETADGWFGARIAPNGPIPMGDDWLVSVSYNGVSIDSTQFSVR